jgi:hypothetical protein
MCCFCLSNNDALRENGNTTISKTIDRLIYYLLVANEEEENHAPKKNFRS